MVENRAVVYTAVLGNYEALVEQPMAKMSGVAFVCYTDQPELRSDSWDVRVVEPAVPWDPARSVRYLKILGHPELDDYEVRIWIDNRIVLTRPPLEMAERLLRDSELAMFEHDHRDSVEDEFRVVLRTHLDSASRVRELHHVIKQHAPEVLQRRPLWGAIILRRRSASVSKLMNDWYALVLRYSRRDQLSLHLALWMNDISPTVIHEPNRRSSWHEWLTTDQLPKDKSLRFSTGWTYRPRDYFVDYLYGKRGIRYSLYRLRMLLDGRR